ncbi:hypothetical protein H0X06_01095 [Candidatus Dependentiae bacterium]|nr:hypothetical protein [Candidatus Dependentiae bacterium]
MIALAAFIHYITIGLTTAASSIGVSLGQAAATRAGLEAIDRQPAARTDIARTLIIALALIETGAMLGLLVPLILFFRPPLTFNGALAEIGVGIAISLPALFTGYASSMPASEAFNAMSRQPFLAKKIRNILILSQSLIQTPLIFGFCIALLIASLIPSLTNSSQAMALIASGLSIGLGCVGPAVGSGYFTAHACKSTGFNKTVFQKIFTFTLISQAIIETPVIFASIISLLLLSIAPTVPDYPVIGLAYLVFAFTMGIGTLGAGISSGRVAASAALQIGYNPSLYTFISRSSMLAQGLIDTIPIYAFIIALWLLFTPLIKVL